jgi:hypothetical protein
MINVIESASDPNFGSGSELLLLWARFWLIHRRISICSIDFSVRGLPLTVLQ